MKVQNKVNLAVISYLSIFLIWVVMGLLWTIASNNQIEQISTINKFLGVDFSLKSNVANSGLLVFAVVFLLISRTFIRVDGYIYLPSKSTLIISDKLFLNKHKKVLHVLYVFVASTLLFLTIDPDVNLKIIYSVLSFVFFVLAILIIDLKEINHFKELNYFKSLSKKGYTYIIIIFTTILALNLNILEGMFNYENRILVFATVTLIIPYLYIFVFATINVAIGVSKKNIDNFSFKLGIRRIISFLGSVVFMEYRAADQSKRNAENLAVLSQLYKNAKKPLEFENSDLIELLSLYDWKLFLNDNNQSKFLELKRKNDFIKFLEKVEIETNDFENINKEEKELLLNFKKDFQYFAKPVMEARTNNIKIRNRNNLIIGLSLFLLTLLTVFIYFIFSFSLIKTAFNLIMIGAMIRLIYRSVEICRAFYLDLTERKKLPRTYLSGQDRITLAIKSLLEITLLCGTIYISFGVSLTSFNIDSSGLKMIFTVIGHSMTASLFNVSYPGLLSDVFKDVDGINYAIILTTHILQIVTSVVLITMSIAGYLNFPKVPMFYYIESNGNTGCIVKKSLKETFQKTIIEFSNSDLNSEIYTKQEILGKIIREKYKIGSLSEEEAECSIELVEYEYKLLT